MTYREKGPDVKEKKNGVDDLQQDSSVTDKNRKDRPGVREGQPSTNDDYDYRPDYGTSGGGAEQGEDQVMDGAPNNPKAHKRPKQEGDNPQDLDQPEEKWQNQKPEK